MALFLNSQFYFIELYIYPYVSTALRFETGKCEFFNFGLSQDCLVLPGALHFYIISINFYKNRQLEFG